MGSRGRSCRSFALLLALGTAPALACSSSQAPTNEGEKKLPKATPLEALEPSNPSPFAPAFVVETSHVEGAEGSQGPQGSGSRLADVDGCAECHTDAFAGWKASAHSFASFDDPVYRVAVERLRKERGTRESRMCAGCHDVALLVDGAMDHEIRPDDPRAHAGVSCRVCHGITGVRPDGNGSFDLDGSAVPVPRQGDPESLRLHRERIARPILRDSSFCLGCHKSFLDHSTGNTSHLVGQDDASPWKRSAYAGSHAARIDAEDVPETDCRGCHMPRVPANAGDPGAKNGTIASHAFLGGHTWMASIQRDPELRRRAEDFLSGSARIDVVGLIREDGSQHYLGSDPLEVREGERLVLDVSVKNLRTGHRFPGGVMDAQDTWVELTVRDARGALVAEAGTEHEATGHDPRAHRFVSYVADATGKERKLRETHEFRAGVFNTTILPRDAAGLRYGFEVPRGITLPLVVRAELRHRTRNLELAAAACADTKTERGRAFASESPKKRGRAFDACEPMPVTLVSESEARLGLGPASDAPESADFARTFAWAQGLSHALQERLDETRVPLALALGRAKTQRERAMAMGLLAEIEAKEGRASAAFAAAHKAEDWLGTPAPSMARVRGEALAAEWNWEGASSYFAESAALAPKDDTTWVTLAVTSGGSGKHASALDAARVGLALQPRDADLLRVTWLALDKLSAPAGQVARAEQAFLERRTPDDAPAIRARCSKNVPGCARERDPVHVIELRPRVDVRAGR